MDGNDVDKIAIIPKGTVVSFNGEPCRLLDDTRVVNAYMARVGFEEYERLTKPQGGSGILVFDQEPLGQVSRIAGLPKHRIGYANNNATPARTDLT